MADANSPEYPRNPEQSPETLRRLISEIAQRQLEALGYKEALDKFKKWVAEDSGNPEVIGRFYSPTGVETDKLFTISSGDRLEVYLKEIKRIPDKEQARKLVSAALFGIPVSQDENGVVIASYNIEEPSNTTTQTEFDPNRDSKGKIKPKPNIPGSRLLVSKVAGTGFLSQDEVGMKAIRQVTWTDGIFEGTYQNDPSVEMRINPSENAFHVEIRKSL